MYFLKKYLLSKSIYAKILNLFEKVDQVCLIHTTGWARSYNYMKV